MDLEKYSLHYCLTMFLFSSVICVVCNARRIPEGRNMFYTDGRRIVEVLYDHMDIQNQPLCSVFAQSDLPHTVMRKPLYVEEDAIDKMVAECHRKANYTIDILMHIRRKRGIIPMFPGTKWCGNGNISRNYDDLGKNKETDKCCRSHDHCIDYILPFTRRYGLFNWSIFTKCSCECDNQFYDCLKNSTDAAADTIGYIFFNILGRECFQHQFPEQCIRRIIFFCVEHDLVMDKPKVMRFIKGRKF